MAVQHIKTLAEFENLLKQNTFVVTDFFADWCPPCKAIAPLYSQLASSNTIPGQLVFAKVNVDSSPDIAQRHEIAAMPTFLFFEKGQPYSGQSKIRGADPRGIQAVVASMAAAAAAAKAKAAPAKSSDDDVTVSGGYNMNQESGKRADWKMSLSA